MTRGNVLARWGIASAGAVILAAGVFVALSVGENFADTVGQDVAEAPITFRFEDYEAREIPGKTDTARATAALYESFPIGSEVERIKRWAEEIGGKCYYNPEFSVDSWSCYYKHDSRRISSRYPYLAADWRFRVYFSGEPQIIKKINVLFFLLAV